MLNGSLRLGNRIQNQRKDFSVPLGLCGKKTALLKVALRLGNRAGGSKIRCRRVQNEKARKVKSEKSKKSGKRDKTESLADAECNVGFQNEAVWCPKWKEC